MKEFMLLIRNEPDGKAAFTSDHEQKFLNSCRTYIENLKRNGNLISAQPLVREGKVISGTTGAFTDKPYSTAGEMIVGYYHIRAADINEAVAIAKNNPEFSFVKDARIEVRPIKTAEVSTSYVYPGGTETQ